jgi:hypothetical protein
MLPRAAPRPRAGACTLESSLRCLRTSDHRALRGVLEIRENRPPPDDAGPALQEPASAYPETRMLPRAAPRPRAGACTLESSLRCLCGSSSSPGGCWKFKKIDLHPTMLDRRFKSRHLLTQRRACCPGLPRGPEQAPAPWSPPSAACADRLALPGGVGNSRKSTFTRRCWTGASRAGICLPRDAHAAPGCPEAPSRRLHPGVLPPLPAHLRSSISPWGQAKSRKSTSPDDAGPALQEPASAYPETRMLPRAAPRPRAGACTLESSLRCLRGSSSSPVGCWKFEKIDLPPTMLDRRFKSRHLLTQRRACCPGLPRGLEHAPAPWSPPSAACAPRIIEFSGGC